MPSYVKAYTVRDLKRYPLWKPAGEALGDDTIVFMNEACVVAKGPAKTDEVIFSEATPAWIEFCRQVLQFAVPDWDAESSAARAAVAAAERTAATR
jgi:hypothetical protein